MKIGLIGQGAIGSYLKEKIEQDSSLELIGVFDVDKTKTTVNSIEELLEKHPDLVVEAAGFEAVKTFAEKVLSQTNFLIMSVSALAEKEMEEKIIKLCKKNNTKFFVPSGAIIGLDGISAVKEQLESAELETRKNPHGFGREDKKETVLFDGNAREACRLYPKNVNVSATLSLNGIGFDKTKVRIISDPKTQANTHTIIAKGSFGKFTIKVEAAPSKNPKTSSLAGMSAFDLIKKIQNENSLY
ncbi:MAG: aspartate dehydrogenase [archaeon]|nr:aspartate dehydrogenase [archaeon]